MWYHAPSGIWSTVRLFQLQRFTEWESWRPNELSHRGWIDFVFIMGHVLLCQSCLMECYATHLTLSFGFFYYFPLWLSVGVFAVCSTAHACKPQLARVAISARYCKKEQKFIFSLIALVCLTYFCTVSCFQLRELVFSKNFWHPWKQVKIRLGVGKYKYLVMHRFESVCVFVCVLLCFCENLLSILHSVCVAKCSPFSSLCYYLQQSCHCES